MASTDFPPLSLQENSDTDTMNPPPPNGSREALQAVELPSAHHDRYPLASFGASGSSGLQVPHVHRREDSGAGPHDDAGAKLRKKFKRVLNYPCFTC
jgi:hypothetical protein